MPVILLSRDDQTPGSARVVRLDSANRVMWEVTPEGGSDEFTQMEIEEDVVKAWTWSGYLYRIALADGQILDIEFVK
jgi:hypothetical protein